MRSRQFFRSQLLIDHFFGAFFALFFIITIFHANSSWITGIISFPLIFLYPGFYLSKFWKPSLPVASRISLSFTFSIALHLALLSLFKSVIPLSPSALSWYLLIVSALVGVFHHLFVRQKAQTDTLPYDSIDYLIAGIPFLFFFINFILSPVISEGDSYYFIYAALDSFKAGRDVSPYINRPGFIPFLGLTHLAGNEGFLFIFRLLLPLLFYLSSLMVFDYIRHYSAQYTFNRWFFLLFLAAPVLTTEVDIARTQSLVFAFTIPVLIFLSEFQALRDIWYFFIALALALIGTRIHELSYVLLFTALLSGAVYGIRRLLHLSKRKVWLSFLQVLAILGIVGYPYFLLIFKDPSFRFIQNSTTSIFHTIFHPHWNWWFLSNYSSDGFQVGWSGVQAILYYLYNGIIFYLAAILLLAVTKKRVRWSLTLAPLIFTIVYLIVAEILPRLGLYYYPNRAWPHMMIGAVLLIISLTMEMQWRKKWLRLLALIALGGALLAGLIGWIRLTYDKGGFFMEEEVAVRNYIRDQIPSNATIFTVQSSNQAIINVYGHKQSIAIPYQTTFTNPNTLLEATLQSQQQATSVQTDVIPYLKRTIIESKSGTVLSENSVILPPTVITIPEPKVPQGPLYFYFSFARFNGYMGARDWWRTVNSYQNYNFFKGFPDQNVVYRDNAGIIIKLQ